MKYVSVWIVWGLKMKMEPTASSETSAIRTQTPGNYPKRNTLHVCEVACQGVTFAQKCGRM